MILATVKPNGQKVYFDAKTGNQYKPGRETGKREGRIPNDVIRFLSPKIEDRVAQGSMGKTPASTPTKNNLELKRRLENRISVWSMIWNWFKSLFNGRK